MGQVSFASVDVPKTIDVGSIPTLSQSTLTAVTPTDIAVSSLQAIYLTLDITPPSDGSMKLDVFVGPDTIPELENLTCLHNSYQGNLFLGGVTYPTSRQVYAYPLINWIPTIQALASINWLLSVYNWSDNAGTINSWSMTYFYGLDATPAAQPLNPVVRGIGRYFGSGSGFVRTSNYTRKILTCTLGMVDAPIPILYNLSKIGNVVAAFDNNDVEGDVTIALYKVSSTGVMSQLFQVPITVPVGFNSFYLPLYTEFLNIGDHLFYTVESTDIVNTTLTIQTALMGV